MQFRARLAVLAIVLAGAAGLVSPLAGAAADALLVAGLGIRARRSAPAAGLLLVPMLRLLWVVMPVRGLDQVHWIPLIAIPFLAVTVLVAWSSGVRPALAGLRPGGSPFAAFLVVAGWVVAGAALALVAGDAVAWGRVGDGIAWALVVLYAPLVAVAEEYALRGVVPWTLMTAGPRDAVPLAAVAAASLAFGAGDPWWAAIALATAMVNAVVAYRTRSILAAIAGHTAFLVILNL